MKTIDKSSWFPFRSISIAFAVAAAVPVAGYADVRRPALAAPASTGAPPAAKELPEAGSGDHSAATSELRREQEHLNLENGVAEQKSRKELARLVVEKQRRELENTIAQQRLQAEVGAMQADTDRLARKIDFINKQAAIKEAERKARLENELGDLREKLERARASNDLAATELTGKRRELDQLNAELELREKRDHWKNRVNQDIHYTTEPFKNGVLTISDRRIALNGPIVRTTAQHIAERVNYFNNQSRELPIFLVIDNSPGGSVAAGYQILKTMQGSSAPVYVVVKSFAASMAACITTLAKRSFAYPNALIIHHQMSSGSMGNMTALREDMKEKEEWWKRLAAPLATKMGISLEEFVKRMYQHRSTGDWQEFADVARKLKWVDEVVEIIREESYVKNPDAPPPANPHSFPLPLPTTPPIIPIRHAEVSTDQLVEQVDTAGHHYMALPRISPVDAYYLYNPDGYYRMIP